MKAVLCFGELLLRLSPDLEGKWLDKNSITFYVGGAEANVAAALAKWDVPVKYCTAIPENYLSKQMADYLAKKNIDVTRIIYCGDKLGLYYLPENADLKHHSVIYDRNNSSFATLKKGTIDWHKVLDGIDWFHFSAISPAISRDVAEICKEALTTANKKNITVSVDLNYRSKLWQYGDQPAQIMPGLVEHCDIIMGNVWAASTMLNMPLDGRLREKDKKEIYLEQSKLTSEAIIRQFPRCKAVANTFRFEEEKKIKYYATLFTNNSLFVSKEHFAEQVTDKVGSGDCFMAGLIYGFHHGLQPQNILDFATAAAFEKLFVKGDFTDKTTTEINATIKK